MHSKTVIIGAGFAGRQACKALRRAKREILLIDPRESTVMLPALPDLAGGWVDAPLLFQPLEKLLPGNVRHLRKRVQRIDLEQKTLSADGECIDFDHLLIACGSVTDFHGFDQHLEKIHRLDSLESALEIRETFGNYVRAAEQPRLLIAGGGYTGLELAMSLICRPDAQAKRCGLTIVDPGDVLLPFLPEQKRRRVKRALDACGADVLHGTRVTDFDGTTATAGDRTFRNVFFCWAGGWKRAITEIDGSAEQLRDGRLRVNPDLSIPGHPDVFAAGDAAAIEQRGSILRKAINFSWYAGKCAGKNMKRRLNGKETRPFRPVDAGWVIPLHTDSVGQVFSRIWIGGKTGLRLHYFMCGFRNYSFAKFAGFVRIAAMLFSKKEVPQ